MMPSYLVTGGAGFIGSNITKALVERGESVRVLDSFATGREENIEEFAGKIELIKGDIRDLNIVKKAVKDVQYVIHQAALPSVARSIEEPTKTGNVNILGTLNVLSAAKDAKVKRVVYASSSSIYGNTSSSLKREDMPPNPISPYALTKYVGEEYCKIFFQLYGLETVVLRYFNVFGPRQYHNSQYAAVIPRFIQTCLSNTPLKIYGDGEQSRDFTYVENVVQANLLACQAENVSGHIFNIACGKQTTINQLASKISLLLGSEIKTIRLEPRQGDVRHSLADITKAREILGYEPKVDFETGLFLTLEWFINVSSG